MYDRFAGNMRQDAASPRNIDKKERERLYFVGADPAARGQGGTVTGFSAALGPFFRNGWNGPERIFSSPCFFLPFYDILALS